MKLLKRLAIGISILFTFLFVLAFALRVSGALQHFKMASESSEPALKVGEDVFASKLIAPQVNDFVCYSAFDSATDRDDVLVYRLCAKGGDRLEIKDGVVILNGVTDTSTKYNYEYMVPKTAKAKLEATGERMYDGMYSDDSVRIIATERLMKASGIPGKMIIYPNGYSDETMARQWHHSWNVDQFGPVTVPADCYFFLGDNRHNAFDSRYRGFVRAADFKGTVIGKR